MAKFKSRFNSHTTVVDAYWVPDLKMWVIPSDNNYIAYLWSPNEFEANFEETTDE